MREGDTYRFGLWAEQVSAWRLRLRGYRILACRYKTPVGEIDLVARKKNTLVFIEVKARKDLSTALQAVTPRMQHRIERAANYFLAKHSELSGLEMRFDLIAVAPRLRWRHLDNAWQASA
ncbi:MAG: YraN family protein [Rhodospirillales bacterium]|nr:YraN family protein [Rhodospirillales bacterium]MCB9994964.1 YraN family protein [Rhodospirillales bacterium]